MHILQMMKNIKGEVSVHNDTKITRINQVRNKGLNII